MKHGLSINSVTVIVSNQSEATHVHKKPVLDYVTYHINFVNEYKHVR